MLRSPVEDAAIPQDPKKRAGASRASAKSCWCLLINQRGRQVNEFIDPERFEQDSCIELKKFLQDAFIDQIVARHHSDRHPLMICPHMSQKPEAVENRHTHV